MRVGCVRDGNELCMMMPRQMRVGGMMRVQGPYFGEKHCVTVQVAIIDIKWSSASMDTPPTISVELVATKVPQKPSHNLFKDTSPRWATDSPTYTHMYTYIPTPGSETVS